VTTVFNSGAVWVPQPRPAAKCHLYCFAYAGAGASVFRGWEQAFGDDVEVRAIQLPGREWRRRESLLHRMDAIVDALLEDVFLQMNPRPPYAFFGYSMGAAVAFSLACRLRDQGRELPLALQLAACRAPQLLAQNAPIYALDDDGFLDAVRRFGGMPDAVLGEPELLQLVLPVLRADFEVLGTYRHVAAAPLPVPMTLYGGTQDPHAPRAELAAWRQHTAAEFSLRLFPGSHFFINEVRSQFLRTVAADLASIRQRPERHAEPTLQVA
jgi:surfactin synthase thioesterase subunit